MAANPSDAEAFSNFLSQRIASDGSELTPEELLQEWRAAQPQYAETLNALRESIAEMEGGAEGRPLREVAFDIRQKHGFDS